MSWICWQCKWSGFMSAICSKKGFVQKGYYLLVLVSYDKISNYSEPCPTYYTLIYFYCQQSFTFKHVTYNHFQDSHVIAQQELSNCWYAWDHSYTFYKFACILPKLWRLKSARKEPIQSLIFNSATRHRFPGATGI